MQQEKKTYTSSACMYVSFIVFIRKIFFSGHVSCSVFSNKWNMFKQVFLLHSFMRSVSDQFHKDVSPIFRRKLLILYLMLALWLENIRLCYFYFELSFILHHLENRTWPASAPHDGRHWWNSNKPACICMWVACSTIMLRTAYGHILLCIFYVQYLCEILC